MGERVARKRQAGVPVVGEEMRGQGVPSGHGVAAWRRESIASSGRR